MATDEFSNDILMPLETPILKVSRPVAACTRCRMAKIKCDGRLPACTSCERTGRASECTSTSDQFAKGKERSYVSTLETRIEKLQEKLDEARRRKPSVISIPDDATAIPSRRQSFDNLFDNIEPPAAGTKAQRRKENHAIDDLVSDFGFLSVNATARDFYGFTTAMSYSRLIVWASSRDPLPEGVTKALPARHVTTRLLQHYLTTMHQLVPFVEEAVLYNCVNNVYSHDYIRAEAFDHWVVRMVLAVVHASMSDRSGDQNYLEGIGHVCAALEHAEAVLHPGAISSVQALVILVQYALLDPHHFDAWTLVGAASRAMVDLGLHQDPPKGAAMAKSRLEARRRIFWAVYVLDRSISLVQSRAFSFSDDSTKVKNNFAKAPSTAASPIESRERSKSWLNTNEQALDLITLRQLQSSWYADLFQSGRNPWDEPYPYLWNVCERLKKWFDKLSPTTPPQIRTYFELELLYSYIYILAPSPRVPTIVPYAQTLIFEFCIRYADILTRLLNEAKSAAPLTFTDAMRAYMIGRFFLDILQQNTDGLLSGTVPSLPGVPPSASPPPSMPEVSYPTSESPQYFNTIRAIKCIKSLTECLSRFGLRWGYLSWSQHYATATAPMLDRLNRQIRDLEIVAGVRRPSMWHSTSHGSASSIGSMDRSPHNSISSQQFQPSIAPAVQAMSYGGSPPQQLSPGVHHGPQLWQQGSVSPYHSHHNSSSGLPTTMQQDPASVLSFADTSVGYQQTTAFTTAPHSQFGNWTGYSGPTVANTLDEDNAAAPPNMTWDHVQNQ